MLTLMIAALVAATLFCMFLYQHASVLRIKNKAYATLGAAAAEERDAFLTALEWQYLSLETVAQALAADEDAPVEETLERMRRFSVRTGFPSLYIAYPDGTSNTDDGRRIGVADRLYFAQSMAGKRGLDAVVSRVDGAPRFIISVPVYRAGAVAYVLYAACREQTLRDMLVTTTGFDGSYSMICRADGERIAGGYDETGGAPAGNLFVELAGEMDTAALASMRDDFMSGASGIAIYGGRPETYIAYTPLGLNGYMMCSVAPATSVNEEVRETVRAGYLIIASIMLISAAFVLIFAWLIKQNAKRTLHDQARLNESDARYRMAIENTLVAIWDYDIKNRRLTFDERSRKLMGVPSAVMENAPEALIESGYVHETSAQKLLAMHEKLLAGERTAEGVLLIRPAGEDAWRYEHIRYTTLFDEKGAPYHAVGMGEDVTAEYAERRMMDELSAAAQRDSMTGLLNHDATFEHIKRFLHMEGASGMHAIFMIDIDDFKLVNDRLGHQQGDAAIKRFARAIRLFFRASDIVGRVGGDEFMVLMKDVPDMDFIQRKAGELVAALRESVGGPDALPPVTASVGVAVYRGDHRAFEQIYTAADGALYRAKSAGKDRYSIEPQEEN